MCNMLHKKRLICIVKCLIIKEFAGFLRGTRFGRQKGFHSKLQNSNNE
jgi:hypothetical protein